MLITTILLLLSPAVAADGLSPIANTRHEREVTAKSDGGDITIAHREMYVDILPHDGAPRKGALLVIFDAASGQYLYEWHPVPIDEQKLTISSGYGSRAVTYVARDRIIVFGFSQPSLLVHESFAKASSMDEAELGALWSANGGFQPKSNRKPDNRLVVELGLLVGQGKLPQGFFQTCHMCANPPPARMVSVERKGVTWEIVLQGQWREKLILDEKYQFKDSVRIE